MPSGHGPPCFSVCETSPRETHARNVSALHRLGLSGIEQYPRLRIQIAGRELWGYITNHWAHHCRVAAHKEDLELELMSLDESSWLVLLPDSDGSDFSHQMKAIRRVLKRLKVRTGVNLV